MPKSKISKAEDEQNKEFIKKAKKYKRADYISRNYKARPSRAERAEYVKDLIANPLKEKIATKSDYFTGLKLIKQNPKLKPENFKANKKSVEELVSKIKVDAINKIKNLFETTYTINGVNQTIFSLPRSNKGFNFQSKYNPIKSILKLKQDLLRKYSNGLVVFLQFTDYTIYNGTRVLFKRLVKVKDLNQDLLEKLYNEFIKLDEDYEGVFAGIDINTFLSGTIKISLTTTGGCSTRATHEANKNNNMYVIPRSQEHSNNCALDCLRVINSNIPSPTLIRKHFNIPKKEMISIIRLYEIAFYYKINIDIVDENLTIFACGLEFVVNNDNKVIIELKNNHYTIIKKPRIRTNTRNIKKSKREILLDGDKYNTCDKCFQKYVKSHTCKDEGTARFFLRKQAKESNKIKCEFFDLETRDDLAHPVFITGKKFYPQVATCLSYCSQITKTKLFGRGDDIIPEVHNYIGIDCIEHYLDYLLQKQEDKIVCNIYAHNGSCFDFFLIQEAILRNPKYSKFFKTEDMIIKGTRIIKMCFGCHDFLDTRSFLNGSLKDLCKNFQVQEEYCKLSSGVTIKDKFYTEIELCRIRPELSPTEYISFILNPENIEEKNYTIKYCNNDVLPLAIVWDKFVTNIKILLSKVDESEFTLELKPSKVIKILDCATLPSFAMKIFKHVNEKNYNIPTGSDRDFLEKFIVGGISDANKIGRFEEAKDGHIKCIIDIVSLYPSVMIQRKFPYGPEIKTDVYVNNKLGCYRVEDIVFGNHPDYFKDFPEKTKKGLNWHSTCLTEAYLTTLDIKRIKRNGGTMKIKEGVYWEKTYNPFEFLLNFTNEKQRQDTLKGTDLYNEAMRTVCKLCPNSLYGKMMERSKNYSYKLYDNFNDFGKDIDYQKVGYSNGKYVIKEESDDSKSPIQLGIFILAYARDKIMNYSDMIGRDKIYGLETDSISTDYINIKPIQDSIDPNYKIGIELGQMEIENKTISDIIVCGKKCYGAKYRTQDGKENYKLRFKGVPSYKLNFDIYIELLEKKTYTFNDIVLFIRELYTTEKTRILIGNTNKNIVI